LLTCFPNVLYIAYYGPSSPDLEKCFYSCSYKILSLSRAGNGEGESTEPWRPCGWLKRLCLEWGAGTTHTTWLT
jgi:hypothetical protein